MNDVCNNFNLHRKSIRRVDTIANVSKNHRILVSYQQTVSANPYGIFHRKYFKKYYISGRMIHTMCQIPVCSVSKSNFYEPWNNPALKLVMPFDANISYMYTLYTCFVGAVGVSNGFCVVNQFLDRLANWRVYVLPRDRMPFMSCSPLNNISV